VGGETARHLDASGQPRLGDANGGTRDDRAADEARRAIEAVWRIESARVIAALARMVHDVGLAEDAAADALVAALEQWPTEGVPANPGAWLTAIGKRKAIDAVRRRVALDRKYAEIGNHIESRLAPDGPEPDEVEDDLLRLMFVACHPLLSPDARAALTLRLLGGLSTEEVAHAYRVPEATVGQRISRAKRTLAEADVGFEVPDGAERRERLASVLEVIYLVFNEGYAATRGDEWIRHDLCDEALRLGRILAGLTPNDAEVHGLLALMEIQASRLRARTGPDGEPVLLLDQDRGRWDHLQIRRGLAALERAERLSGGALAPYTVQAAIAACHARARTGDDTDWERIATLYAALVRIEPSPIVELNRAVAVGMAYGPEAGLPLVDAIADDPAMRDYHLLPSVRGDLLAKLGRGDEAAAEFARAASLTRNERERALLLDRAAAVTGGAAFRLAVDADPM
jgi:RNA polymerase sigma factor (sigma-70 family)